MSREDVKAHPVWKALARDPALLNAYADYIFGEYQASFAKDTHLKDVRAMGIFPGSCRGDTPEMRAWCVYGLESRSIADGRSVLDGSYGRLVGLAPEALSAPGRGGSNKGKLEGKVEPVTVSVAQVLEERGLTADYAPNQIRKLQNVLEQGGYRITKE